MSQNDSSIDEKPNDDDIVMSAAEEVQKKKPKATKNKLKDTLQSLKNNKVSQKSKDIKKKDKVVKPIQETITKGHKIAQKPVKIKSPKKPSINFCDITYQPIIATSDGKQPEVTKFQGGWQALKIFAQNAFISDQPCLICQHKTGLKTQTSAGQIHVICGLLCDLVSVNYTNLKMDLEYGELTQQEGQKCDICAQSGHLLRCLHKSCKKQVHVFCVMEQYKMQKLQEATTEVDVVVDDNSSSGDDEEDIEGWLLEFRLQDYTKQKYIGHNDILKSVIHAQFTDFKLLTPENSPSKTGEPKSLQDDVPSRVNLPQRGGKVQLACEEHRPELEHCHCQVQSQHQHMVMCDYCQRWQHTKCEGLKSTEAKLLTEYKCTICREWEEKQLEVVDRVIQLDHPDCTYQSQSDFTTWDSWKRSILPTQLQVPYTLQVILQIAHCWQLQAKMLQDCPCTLEILKQQILVAQYIPLRLNLEPILTRIQSVQQFSIENPLPTFTLAPILINGTIDNSVFEQNQVKAQEAKQCIQDQFKKIQVMTYECTDLQKEIVDQQQQVHRVVMMFSGKDKLTIQELEDMEITSDENLRIKVQQFTKEALKWEKQETLKKSYQGIQEWIQQMPQGLDCTQRITEIQQELTVSDQWQQQYDVSEDKLLHLMTLNSVVYKSKIQLQLYAEMKQCEIYTPKDRLVKCVKHISDSISNLPQNMSITELVKAKLQQAINDIKQAEVQVTNIINKSTLISQQVLDQIQEQINNTCALVPGEVEFNKVQQLFKFLHDNEPIQFILLSDINKYQFDPILIQDKVQAIELYDQIQSNIQQIKECVDVTQCIQFIVTYQKQIDQLAKLNVLKPTIDYSKLQTFLHKFQSTDLTFPTASLLQQQLNQAIQLSKSCDTAILKQIQQQLQGKKGMIEFSSVLESKVTLKKLQQISQKVQDPDQKLKIDERLQQVQQWQSQFTQQMQLTDSQLRKQLNISDGPKEILKKQEQLLNQATQIQFDPSQDEQQQLQKVRKWAQIVQSCWDAKTLTKEQLEKLQSNLKNLKSLPQEIDICKEVSLELQSIQQFQTNLDEIVAAQSCDMITQVEQLIQSLSGLKLVNLEVIVSDIQESIEQCKLWVNKFNQDKQLSELDDELESSNKLDFIPELLKQQLKIKLIKQVFNQKLPVDKFVQEVNQILKGVIDQTDLNQELKLLDLAKQIIKYQKNKTKTRIHEDLLALLNSDLPFVIPTNITKELQTKLQLLQELQQQQCEGLNELQQLLQNLQQIPIESNFEIKVIQKIEYIVFSRKLWKIIQELKDGDRVSEEDFKNLTDVDTEEANKCLKFFENQIVIFNEIKSAVDGLDQGTFKSIFELHSQLLQLKVDFGKKETSLKQSLWTKKIEAFAQQISGKRDEELHADYLRYWIEEGQELELTKDPKYDLLNEEDDKVEYVFKSCRLCTSIKDLTEVKAYVKEISPTISFQRVFEDTEQRIKDKGDGVACVVSPVEQLKKMIQGGKKKDMDSDEHMTNVQAMSSDDEVMTQEEESQDEVIAKVPKGDKLDGAKKKRSLKAASKETAVQDKQSSKKLEEMKQRIKKNIKSDKPKAEVVKKPAQVVAKIASKKVIVTKSKESVKQESPQQKPGIKGLAGGVKIGGSIKSKLASLKKPTEKPTESKIVDEDKVNKPSIDEKVIEKQDEPMPKAPEEPEIKADVKPKLTKKPVVVKKTTVEEPQKVVEPPKKVAAAKKTQPVEEVKQQKPAVTKPLTKKPIIAKKKEEDAETAEKTPAVTKPSLINTKPMIGIKRKPLGGSGGLAASLKKLS